MDQGASKVEQLAEERDFLSGKSDLFRFTMTSHCRSSQEMCSWANSLVGAVTNQSSKYRRLPRASVRQDLHLLDYPSEQPSGSADPERQRLELQNLIPVGQSDILLVGMDGDMEVRVLRCKDMTQ